MSTDGLQRLREVMDTLRSPGGCPWDADQTHESLVQYLVEETFETVDAIDSGDREHLLEELGDVLLQVFFHARIAEEHSEHPFSIDDVAHGIADKLMRRHPHVFPDAEGKVIEVETAGDVEARWQELKNAEKSRSNPAEGVPSSLPAFTQANKLIGRLNNAGAMIPISDSVIERAQNLLNEEDDAGEILIALIALLRARGHDADALLRNSVREFRTRIELI